MPANICASARAHIGRSSYVGGERYLSWREQPDPQRLGARLAASVHVELSQDRRDVVRDGLLGDDQVPGDLGVALTVCQQRQHLELASREAGGVLTRART